MATLPATNQPTQAPTVPLPRFFGILVAIFVGALVLAALIKPVAIPFWTFTAADVGRILTPLVLIALFIERALEVFITSYRQLGADQLDQSVAAALKDTPQDSATINALKSQCLHYTAETRRLAFVSSLLIGFFVAVVGVRCIEPFVQSTAFDPGTGDLRLGNLQQFFFKAVDILLTAALLAGGAEGIHKIMNVFNEYADAAANNAKKS